jgi:hypothetical protein
MVSKIIIAIALVTVAANFYLSATQTTSASDVESQFADFIIQERRSYFSKDEYSFRLGVFSANLKKIDEMNANPNDEAVYGVT